jgi:Hydroxymethylglutaryl-CoA reductase
MTAQALAQNYSAIRALSTEGIQKGHMRLHARNLAAAAGATTEQIDEIVRIND